MSVFSDKRSAFLAEKAVQDTDEQIAERLQVIDDYLDSIEDHPLEKVERVQTVRTQ